MQNWENRGERKKVKRLTVMAENPGKTELNPSPEREAAKLNMLIVDDSPNVRKTVKAFVSMSTIEQQVGLVEEATDGQAALDMIQNSPGKFNVVLTDGKMPGKNGIELADRIREEGMDIVVGLISGGMEGLDLNRPEDVKKIKDLHGIDAVLPKPFGLDQFSEFMKKIIDCREAKNELKV